MLTEVHLLESHINHSLQNIPKGCLKTITSFSSRSEPSLSQGGLDSLSVQCQFHLCHTFVASWVGWDVWHLMLWRERQRHWLLIFPRGWFPPDIHLWQHLVGIWRLWHMQRSSCREDSKIHVPLQGSTTSLLFLISFRFLVVIPMRSRVCCLGSMEWNILREVMSAQRNLKPWLLLHEPQRRDR